MKKTIIFSSIVVAMAAFVACNNVKPKTVVLKTPTDSLNYALGAANGDEIRQYLMQKDSSNKAIKSFIAGMQAGFSAPEEKENDHLGALAKQIGSSLAAQESKGLMNDSTLKMKFDLIRQGLLNGMLKDTTGMKADFAQTYLNTTMQKRMEAQLAVKFKAQKEAGEKFMTENAKKAGITTTASGLQYEVIKQGTGKMPTDTNKVMVNYKGTLVNGTVFDSTAVNTPREFAVTGVIKGWTEALKMMPEGSKWRLYVPQELAYGSQQRGLITPFSPLIFDIELVSVK